MGTYLWETLLISIGQWIHSYLYPHHFFDWGCPNLDIPSYALFFLCAPGIWDW
jgi:hypothetical protein